MILPPSRERGIAGLKVEAPIAREGEKLSNELGTAICRADRIFDELATFDVTDSQSEHSAVAKETLAEIVFERMMRPAAASWEGGRATFLALLMKRLPSEPVVSRRYGGGRDVAISKKRKKRRRPGGHCE